VRIVVAITGASGAAYGVRFVERAAAAGATIDLIVSTAGARVAREELDLDLDPAKGRFRERLGEHAARVTRIPLNDIGAECASGSVPIDGMAVVPCSMGTLGRIAGGMAQNLIERAADVQLKERRPLVLVPREAPLNRIHLENLLRAHDAGAIVLPAMPAFYAGAASVADLVDTVVDRALAVFFGPTAIRSRWVPPRAGGGA
jgi:flavin prenyltransferase